MRILLPIEYSNSITHSATVAGCAVINSTNAGAAAFFWTDGSPSSRLFAPYSPTAEDEQPDADRAPAPVLLPPAKASQAASSDAADCCETHQTVVAIARLAQGWRMRFCCSISADLGD